MINNCYNILYKVFADGAFVNIELGNALNKIDEKDRPIVTRIVYGVIEKYYHLDYVLGQLVHKPPKIKEKTLLLIGLYRILFMDEPDYAVVNTMVGFAKKLHMSGGFVNAVLRKAREIKEPNNINIKKSIDYNIPAWMVQLLEKDYSAEFVREYFSAPINTFTHIRHNPNIFSKEEFEKLLDLSICKRSRYGYYVTHSTLKTLESHKNSYTVQGLGSIIVAQAVCDSLSSGEVLDLCAAPGGKSVYIAQYSKAKIISCDIYTHRLELIKNYAEKMNVGNITAFINDATVYNPDFKNRFDVVLCDVPCSGLGVLNTRGDIIINRKLQDIFNLAKLQRKIINTASQYVKPGGYLVYSTCTITKAENEQVVNDFLKDNTNYEASLPKIEIPHEQCGRFVKLLPQISGTEGFFIAKLRRKE